MDKKVYMQGILELREKLYSAYIGYDRVVNRLLRFFVSFVVFFAISKTFSYYSALSGFFVVVMMAFVAAFLPDTLVVLMCMAVVTVQTYFLSPVLALLVLVLCLLMYVMFLSYAPKTSLATVLLPVAILCKIPVAIPVVLGLFCGPAAVLSVAGGTCIYYVLETVKKNGAITQKGDAEILTLLQNTVHEIMYNKEMYVVLASLCVATIVAYVIRTRKINYGFEIAIVAGVIGALSISLIGNVKFSCGMSVGWIFFGNMLAGVIAYAVFFLHMVLDYGATENVQFEDDEYYYYVTAVPKLRMTLEDKKIKRINKVRK